MNPGRKGNSYILFIVAAALLLTVPCIAFSQVHFKGKIVYKKDAKPAAFASIQLLHQKAGSLSDKSGNFSFHVPRVKNDDTLSISSVGYESLKIPVSQALDKTEFVLNESSGNMETVVVKAFTSHDVMGSKAEASAYFRSWNHKKTGGEIGRIFQIPHREFKIDKIRFKVNNRCDTCHMRLHIRKVVNGIPGEELVRDSITVSVKSLTMDDKVPEFDLSAYDYTFTEDEIFVSLEILNCSNNSAEACSFCFVGTEMGEYMYKTRAASNWEETKNDYSIYLKLFLRY